MLKKITASLLSGQTLAAQSSNLDNSPVIMQPIVPEEPKEPENPVVPMDSPDMPVGDDIDN